jgi:hypothetical protein
LGWEIRMRAAPSIFVGVVALTTFGISLRAAADGPNAGPNSPGAGSGAPAANTPSADSGVPPPPAATPDAAVSDDSKPTAVRIRQLEQKTQALKERAWQMKARIQMLKEQMLGGGVGAQAVVTHDAQMGVSFRLTKLVYSLDGTEVFTRTDDTGENLFKTKSFDVFAGPISPGNHTITAIATYMGHGIGPFEYLSKFTFTAKGSAQFVAGEGKIAQVQCKGYEKGGPNAPLEKRAAIDCAVNQVIPDKPGSAPTTQNPGTTPLPASTTPAPAPAPTPAANGGTK